MGLVQSSPRGQDTGQSRSSTKVQQRVQLLEELVSGPSQGRRQQLLQQLTTDSSISKLETGYTFLPSAPEEFKLGCLIAAGSYGRVYAGTYCGQPAALKLLILDEESAAAILNEVRLCLKLNHKNLVRLLDCAVVNTSRQACMTSQGPEGGAQLGWSLSSPEQHGLQPQDSACFLSHLPRLTPTPREASSTPGSPAAASSNSNQGSVIARASGPYLGCHLTGNDLLYHDNRGLGLNSPSGHACFEVWIAMELCDGGTLAEKVQQGFQYFPESHQVDMELLLTLALDIARALSYMHAEHVCHGDLKSENVLLKSLEGTSEGSSACGAVGSCWGDECSWLSMLCSTSSSSTCPSRCRRHSNDSCWSCCSRTVGKGGEASGTSGNSSDCSSTSSPASEGRHHSSRSGSRSGHLLSGLCCMAQATACVGEDADEEYHGYTGGCLCGSCAAALEGSAHSKPGAQQGELVLSGSNICSCSTNIAATQAQQQQQLPYEQLGSTAAAPADSVTYIATLPSPLHSCLQAPGCDASSRAPVSPDQQLAAPGDAAAAHLALLSTLQRQQQQQQRLQQQQPQQGDSGGNDSSQLLLSKEDNCEEEHVAPLSLYTAVREQRRTRRFSRTGLLPNMPAALSAAAGAAARLPMEMHPGRMSSNSSSGSSSPDASASSGEEGEEHCSNATGGAAGSIGGAASSLNLQQVQRQQQQQQSSQYSSCGDEAGEVASRAGSRFDGSAYSSEASSPSSFTLHVAACSSSIMPTVIEGVPGSLPGRTPSGHDVYARRMPPRTRRHSYCYGASYASRVSLLGFSGSSQLYTGVPGISAAEAATAIAAAAEAVKADLRSARMPPSGPRGHRSRRMSWDDRLLQLRNHPAGFSSLSGLGSGCTGVTGLGRVPAALRCTGSGDSAHIDSHMEPLPALGAAAGIGGSSSSGCAAGAAGSAGRVGSRRARRHSWAGLEGVVDAAAAAWGLRSLTSLLLPQDQQEQQQEQCADSSTAAWLLEAAEGPADDDVCLLQGRRRRSSSMDVAGRMAAAGCGSSLSDGHQQLSAAAGNDSSRGSRRARRHSWAGFGCDMPAPCGACVPLGRRVALRALSSCFAAPDVDVLAHMMEEGPRSAHSSQSSQSRHHLFNLAACCGDGSYLPLDDPTEAAADAEAQQPLLAASRQTSAELSSETGSSSLQQLPAGCLGEECAVSISCLGRWGAGSAGSSSASAASGKCRRSSWCCGAAGGSNPEREDWSVSRSSASSAALLPAASFVPSVPLTSAAPLGGGRRRGRQGRRCSWDGARHSAPYDAAALAAAAEAAAAAKLKLLQQLQQQQQQSHGALLRTSSVDSTASTPSLSASAAGSAGPAAATATRFQQQQLNQQHAGSGEQQTAALLDMLSSVPGAGADQQQQLANADLVLVHRSPHTPGVQHAAGLTGAAAEHAQCPPAPHVGLQLQQAPAGPVAYVTPTKCDAVLPELQPPPAPNDAATAVSRRRVSILLPASVATGAAASPTTQDSVGFNMLFGPDGSSAAAAAGVGSMAASAAPQTNFDSILQQQHQQTMSVAVPAAAAELPCSGGLAGSSAAAGCSLERISPVEPFIGSFGMTKHSEGGSKLSSKASDGIGSSSLSKLFPATATASSSSFATASMRCSAGSRERRWSTGVAAHDLLMRQHSLMPCPPFAGHQEGAVPGSGSGASQLGKNSLSLSQRGHGATASGVAEIAAAGQQQKQQGGGSVGGSVGGNVHGSQYSSQHSGSNVVNVLGMPPRPAVLNQRRMSYDTATGVYCLVSKQQYDAPVDQQQQQQDQASQHGHPNSEQGPEQDPEEQQSLADQQHFQAHMQRLVDALARKGYSVPMLDAQARLGSPQQPQQQAGGSSLNAAAGSALQQPAMQTGSACGAAALPRTRFSAKVCDFGFSQCLRAGQSHCSTAAAGTITHQAPEVLRSGYLSPAADVYAFGIILWELLTGERPFRGLLEGDLVIGVCDQGLRPSFPPGAPPAYVALAQQCWAEDAADRPTAAQLLKRLNEMLYDVRRTRAVCSSSSSRDGSTSCGDQACRRRRHSMPAVSAARQRRLSRRLSLFLPFARQPAIREEEQFTIPAGPPSGAARAGAAGAVLVCSSAGHTSAAVSSSGNIAAAGSAGVASGSHATASGCHAVASGSHTVASGSHAVGSGSHGLASGSHAMHSSSHAVRLRVGGVSNSGSVVTCTAAGVPSNAAAAAPAGEDDACNEWFQSFD